MVTRITDVDILAIVKNWTWADPSLEAHFGSDPIRIAAKLDATQPAVMPAARLTRLTTLEVAHRHLYSYTVEVDVYADDDPEAHDAAAALQARMEDPNIVATWPEGVITGYESAQGIREMDDTRTPPLTRYLFATRYFAHPRPAE